MKEKEKGETKLFFQRTDTSYKKYLLIFSIIGVGLIIFCIINEHTELMSIMGLLMTLLILQLGKVQAPEKFVLPLVFISIILFIGVNDALVRGFWLAFLLSVAPYYKFKIMLRSSSSIFEQKFTVFQDEKQLLNNSIKEIKKEKNTIKETLTRYERLYELSRDMAHIEESNEIAERALAYISLKGDFRFIAFYKETPEGYIYITSKGNGGYDINDIDVIRKEAARRNSYLEFPLIAGKEKLGKIICDGVMDDKQVEEVRVLVHQITLGYQKTLLYEKVRELSRKDGLTGLYLRRYLNQRLHEEVKRAKREKYNIAFAMIDLDNFKEYNDKYGHPMGDRALEKVSEIVRQNIYGSDFAGRYGGEEFCIYMPHAEKEGAVKKINNIRKMVELKTPVTVSIGLCLFPEDASTPNTLIECADKALYKAKKCGKNCIKTYETEAKT